MAATERLWNGRPQDDWLTWVDPTQIVSPNPGYCFLRSGWRRDRSWPHRRLVRLRADLAQRPSAPTANATAIADVQGEPPQVASSNTARKRAASDRAAGVRR